MAIAPILAYTFERMLPFAQGYMQLAQAWIEEWSNKRQPPPCTRNRLADN
jgi:hypothetical protein